MSAGILISKPISYTQGFQMIMRRLFRHMYGLPNRFWEAVPRPWQAADEENF